ncbi:MAG: tRNA (adenine-N1)-methyltransferase [Candidatus Binatia bacterium]
MPHGPLAPGENVLFCDRKQRRYLKRLRPGATVRVRDGAIAADELIGLPEGARVRTSLGDEFLVLRPRYADVVPRLPRSAQVIYPKDTAMILLAGDVQPGAVVLEAGVGPGALTMALLRAVGAEGRVVSYELRDDFAAMARENVTRFLRPEGAPNWKLEVRDVTAGIDERDLDTVILDFPEPWRALEAVVTALRAGGTFVGYLPTVLQVKTLVDALQAHRAFDAIETFETLLRPWHVAGASIRPEHRMIAHTAFLIVARRVQPT